VTGGVLQARELRVWVPDDGHFTHMLFAHDGQNLFDPGAIWGGWRLQESVPAEMLVVGIDNTSDRMDEYTQATDTIHGTVYGGEADAYLDLIDEVVRPLAESAYGSADVVGIMGSSLGGLVSLYAAQRAPDRYDMAISLSGTVGWGSIGSDGETLIDLYASSAHADVALFLDSGGGGTCVDSDGDGILDDALDGSDNYCENIQLRDVLESTGYSFEDDLWHWHEPGASHNESAWADRVFRPLEAFSSL
jgi:predicted alpha/beta superfamily hydrolase